MMINQVGAGRTELQYRQARELPKDVLLMIFDRLRETDLGKSRRVCRQWNVIGRDERVMWKFEYAFGARAWYRHFGRVGVEPTLPADIYAVLTAPCPIWTGKKVYETHLLVLIPEKVDGKPFTLDSLGEMIKKPKQDPATKYRGYWDQLKAEFGKQSPGASYWVLMTRDVLEGTRSKSYTDQYALAAPHGAYGVPTLLEAATSMLMHHARSGERLYGDSPYTYTRCQDKVTGTSWQCVVGGFAGAGLYISNYDDGRNVGLAVARKF